MPDNNDHEPVGPRDHDLLIRIDEKVDELKAQFSNHLSHHHKYTLAAWGIVLAAIIGLIFK